MCLRYFVGRAGAVILRVKAVRAGPEEDAKGARLGYFLQWQLFLPSDGLARDISV